MRDSSFLLVSEFAFQNRGHRTPASGKTERALVGGCRKDHILKLRSLAAAPEGALMTSILGMPEGMP